MDSSELTEISRGILPYLAFEIDRAEVYTLPGDATLVMRESITHGMCSSLRNKATEVGNGYTIAIIPHGR